MKPLKGKERDILFYLLLYETSKKGLQLKKVVKYRAIACMLACRILFVTFTLPAIGLCFFFFCICSIVMR